MNHGKKAAPQRPNVWKSIGAPRPQDAANQLFKQVINSLTQQQPEMNWENRFVSSF
jgi:hypothetical protein